MTKTLRDNCDVNIVQQTSCTPPFPDVQMQLKTYFFIPFVRSCMHHNYGVISGSSCMQRLRVAYNFGCRALCNLPWRASASSHQVQWNILTFEALSRRYTYLFLERCRKSNNIWVRASMQSDCLYSSLFFEHYNRILLCECANELRNISLIDGMSCHSAFAFYLDSTNLGIGALLRSSFVTNGTC